MNTKTCYVNNNNTSSVGAPSTFLKMGEFQSRGARLKFTHFYDSEKFAGRGTGGQSVKAMGAEIVIFLVSDPKKKDDIWAL